ncbi:hypothetical protein KJ641_01425 [Patescibacteria group bacterium]|nr:hypothetical protein [Patescibacteria group bacterium]MBU1895512.1 hypothetical protein [Patescibacteria group bacterium]
MHENQRAIFQGLIEDNLRDVPDLKPGQNLMVVMSIGMNGKCVVFVEKPVMPTTSPAETKPDVPSAGLSLLFLGKKWQAMNPTGKKTSS